MRSEANGAASCWRAVSSCDKSALSSTAASRAAALYVSTSLMMMSSLCRSCGDHVAATPELSLRGAANNADGLAETAASASVNRRHDPHVLRQHAVARIGSGQQRNHLDDALFPDRRGLPAVRSPHDNVGEIWRIKQSVRPLDEDGANLLDEAIEVENVGHVEPALERSPELGVGDFLRFELFPAAGVDEDRVREIDLAIGE